MYPQMQPPNPGSPQRSNKTVLIVVTVVAVAIAVVAAAILTFTLKRSDGTPSTTAASASPSSSAASSTEDYRLRGTLTSKASVCSAAALTSQQIPKFAKDLDYSNRPNLDSDIAKARQDLSRLSSRVSPNAESPIGPTVQDWITAYVDLLTSYSHREPADDVKWKADLVGDIAARMNQMCKSG
jgi:hypothetical protein